MYRRRPCRYPGTALWWCTTDTPSRARDKGGLLGAPTHPLRPGVKLREGSVVIYGVLSYTWYGNATAVEPSIDSGCSFTVRYSRGSAVICDVTWGHITHVLAVRAAQTTAEVTVAEYLPERYLHTMELDRR